MNYQAEMDRILAEYTAASHSVRNRFLECDARTTQGGAELTGELREQLRRDEVPPPATPEETAAREIQAERDRLLREAAERRAPKSSGMHAKDYVLPSDWTDEDEARAQGHGQPDSWLT